MHRTSNRLTALFLLGGVSIALASDWPQWRGPSRNGSAPDSPPLAEQWPAKGLDRLWESEPIPSDDDGGHASVVAAGGRVFASLVWHSSVPSETRGIDDLVLRDLGYQSVAGWPKELVAKMENDRLSLDPKLTGPDLDKYVKDWVEKNLDFKKQQTAAGYVKNRFLKRDKAMPLPVYDKLLTVSNKRFPSQAAMEHWVNEQDFSAEIKKQIIEAVPATMRVAEDVVLCLDLTTGKTIWKYKAPGEVVGRVASSTPCVAGGIVYALGSTKVYAINVKEGTLAWSAPLPAKGPASSPMVVDGVLVANAGRLCAFDAASGKPLWNQPKAGGGNSSPAFWKSGDKTVVLCNGRGVLAAMDLKSGEILWTTPAGGDCTPAVVGDTVALQTNNPKVGIFAGMLGLKGFTPLWNMPYDPLRSSSSPLIVGKQMYLFDDNVHFCFDLATGKELWKEKVPASAISSPALVDGKIFLILNGGARLLMLKPSAEKRIELGRANVRALWCPSPAIVDGKLLVRGRKGISCYALPVSGGPTI